MLKYSILFFNFLLALSLSGQSVSLSGTLLDKLTREPIIGATVMVEGTGSGTTSDFDGNFKLANLKVGPAKLVISYVGYKKIVSDLTLEGGENKIPSIQLEEESTVLEDVVVVGKVNRQNASALVMLQQKSPSMVSGISNEDIKRSPDRSTSDVLKRVSGASIQENKFVIIRGLADRYNNAMMNASILPSTEPDRRSFNFDLFPSSVLTNLVIYKTATPDLPGEFAGGIVQVNTREVSENAFGEFSIGSGYNSQSTFRDYSFYKGSTSDWLGFDGGARALNSGVTQEKLKDPASRFATSRLIANDWAVSNFSSMMPSSNLQLSGGNTFNLAGMKLGVIAALSHQNQNRIIPVERNDFNIDKTQLFAYEDILFRKQFNTGAMFNATLGINPRNKISFNNLMTILGDDQYTERNGHDIEQTRYIRAYSMYYTSTSLLTSQLTGEHELNKSGLFLKYALSHSDIRRNTPSFRRMTYVRNEDSDPSEPYIAYIPIGAPSPNFAGRFYSDQVEKMNTGRVDLTIPLAGSDKNLIKVGAFGDIRHRAFDARVFGYTYARNFVAFELLTQDINNILDHQNINENGFVLKESTNPNDSYDAGSENFGGYLMADHYFAGDRFRLIGGARLESFQQTLKTTEFGGKPVDLNSRVLDVLPSLSLVYKLNEKSNFRFSASQTVVRPNFRELAPFSFYDFGLAAAIIGNPELQRTKITNLDIRFEKFFGSNQFFSVSAFTKRFKDPVEQIYETLGAGTRNFLFRNVEGAFNYGAEMELRINMGQFADRLEGLQLRSNLAWIQSMVDFSGVAGQNRDKRELQGQSPYIINLALGYQPVKSGFSINLLYNRIGRRIWLVGSNEYLDTYEAPRDQIDLQIAQSFGKRFQLKLNIGDLLNTTYRFYQDQNDNGKYDQDDTVILKNRLGTNYGLTVTYSIK